MKTVKEKNIHVKRVIGLNYIESAHFDGLREKIISD